MTPAQARTLLPRGTWRFTKPVALLIGPESVSSTESFVAMMQEIPTVTTMGATTGGSSGNPKMVPLLGGWFYTVPRWIAYTAQHQMIEGHGIAPDIPIDVVTSTIQRDQDPVVEHAVTWIRNHPQSGAVP